MSNFSFGTPSTVPAFGSTNTGTTTASTFGAPTLNFGAPAAAPAFGAVATAATPAFGSVATSAAAIPTLGTGSAFGFGGATTTTATSTAAVAPSFSFGNLTAATKTTTAPTLGFGNSLVGLTSTAPTLGLGGTNFAFGKSTATTASTLNFGASTSVAPSFGIGLGASNSLLGKTTALTSTTQTATPFVGLGGMDMSAMQPKLGETKPENFKVKETLVPEEIAKTVDTLKSHIKLQKTISSEIGRTSTSKLTNVSSEVANIQIYLQSISNSVEANNNQIKLLRNETSKAMQALEMAQRTQDTPAGLQYENNAPFQFFQELVMKYEQDLINLRQQIALTERHMQSLTSPQTVNPEDLKRALQQINESFISLAGRVQEIHQKVEAQKEQFLNLRKYRLRDNTNVFAKLDEVESKTNYKSPITAGPSPFTHLSAMDSFGRSFATNTAAAVAVAGGNITK